MPTAVVTGGSGFLGSHICDRLIKEGFSVICIDNLLTGSIGNIEHLYSNPEFTFINHDVTYYIHITVDVDYILHFASPASPLDYQQLPIETLKVGSMGTLNALGLAKKKGARFLLASTSEVYGDPLSHPQKEDYWGNVNPVGPRGVYDEAKRFAEALTMAYNRTHNISTCIARIFNTYGPRMRINDGRAIPAFFTQTINNQPVTIFGDGSQTRSFIYIDDQVEGIFKLLMSDVVEPVNIGNPEEISVIKMAQEIISLTNSSSKIVFKDLPVDDPRVRQPDITRAKTLLDWQPAIPLQEGLKLTFEYFKNLKSSR